MLFQAVMRNYIGQKHRVLDRLVKEHLARIRKEKSRKIPNARSHQWIKLWTTQIMNT